MSQYADLKRRVFECNLELPKRGLVLYTFGNVSAVDRKNSVIAIKPSGLAYEEMTANDIVIVGLDGKPAEGKLKPSSDFPTHLALYRAFSDIGGIVHTHSTYATAWAQAMRPIPILGTTHADHLICDIPVTKPMSDAMIKGKYEEETGNQIVERFKDLDYREVEMVLVACHGAFTWGCTPEKAVYNSAVLEELARMASVTIAINLNTPHLMQALIDKHYQRKHGKNAYYGQSGKSS